MGSEVKFHRGDHSDHSSEMFSTSFCKDFCWWVVCYVSPYIENI